KPAGNFVVNPNNNNPAKFLKTATINEVQQMTAMIDPGSSECMMGHAAAVKCKLQITCSSKGLYGFGSTDEYARHSVQPVDILVGRTWTEQPHIAYLRIGNKLRIGYRDDLPFCNIELSPPPTKDSLTVSETTTVPENSMCWVTLQSKEKRDSNIIHRDELGGESAPIDRWK
ncbi:hypothetical protein HPB47_002904, partial [Ixodes persulcatus]